MRKLLTLASLLALAAAFVVVAPDPSVGELVTQAEVNARVDARLHEVLRQMLREAQTSGHETTRVASR